MLRHMATYIGVCSWLYAIPHELTHYLVARLATNKAHFKVEVACDTAFANWQKIESPAMRFLANLSPTVFGVVLMGLWGYSGVEVSGWRLFFAVGLALYTIPSPSDVRRALGQQDV